LAYIQIIQGINILEIKVSVITTTFQHPKWMLDRAIASVEGQRGVEYEHIIINDTPTKNGMMRTYQEAFGRCAGDYIAFCDGDDYWIDSHKLEKQVEYMENHHDCGLCITKVCEGDTSQSAFYAVGEMPSAEYVNKNMSFDSLLRGNAYINAQSYLIRKSDFDKYINFDMFVKRFRLWDYPTVLELIQHTRIHCLDFYSAVNVINEESVTHTKSRLKRIRYLKDQYKVKWYYIRRYGCKPSTMIYLIYRAIRHIYSIGAKRWT